MTNYMALGEYTAYSEQARGVEFYSNHCGNPSSTA